MYLGKSVSGMEVFYRQTLMGTATNAQTLPQISKIDYVYRLKQINLYSVNIWLF